MQEIWRKIFYDGSELHYAVSNLGRVINTDSNHILKPLLDGGGYQFVVFTTKKSQHHKFKVHRLVALYFIHNPDPVYKIQVNHIDGNKENNRVDNLEWVTAKENAAHAWKHGLSKPKVGTQNGSCKLSEENVHKICQLLEKNSGLTYTEIGIMNGGATKAMVYAIAAKKTWTSISNQYKLPPITPITHNYQRFYSDIDALIMAGETPLTIMKKINLGDDVDYKKYESLVNHRREYLRKHKLIS